MSERGFPTDEPRPPSLVLSPQEIEADEIPLALVDRMLYASTVSLVTGSNKAGKSYFAMQLAMAVATGRDFLDLRTEHKKVLYVCEMTAAVVRQRMRAIARDTGLPMPRFGTELDIIAGTSRRLLNLNIANPEDRTRLRESIRSSGAALCVVDTLGRFTAGADPLDSGLWYQLFTGFNHDLAHATGCGIAILDHTAKNAAANYGTSVSALGAQSKGAQSSTIIGLQRIDASDGGAFGVHVESHFGSWDDSIEYRRPLRSDGTRGAGCVRVGPAEAKLISMEQLRDCFVKHGRRDPNEGLPYFESQAALMKALRDERLWTSRKNQDQTELARRIEQQYGSTERRMNRPILVSRKATAKTWTWIGSLDEDGEAPW